MTNLIDPWILFNFMQVDNVVWYYNINQEQEWNNSKVFPTVKDLQQWELVKQQEQQLFFMARAEDCVILRHDPDPIFLSYLEENGIILPQFRRISENLEGLENEQGSGILIPYINSENIFNEEQINTFSIFGSSPKLVKYLNNKFNTRKWAITHNIPVTRGFFCYNSEDLQHAYQVLREEGFQKVVLKIPYGSSGKGLRILENEKQFFSLLRFIQRRGHAFEFLLEGWHTIDRSLNSQLLIQDEGCHLLAITEQIIDENGVYTGTNYTPRYDDDLLERYQLDIIKIGELLYEDGYRGILGIDSVLDREGKLFPIIEFNARFTQATYLLSLITKLSLKYTYIESRFVRFELTEEHSFDSIRKKLECVIEPEADDGFLIYTFGKFTTEIRTYYRVFILFYGKQRKNVEKMTSRFMQNNFSIF
ncbi:ATP-grasp domain-containing protein [Bacillus cereus group sp. N21]|uniref:ATP-grasp domain-containing protein n=1 Tax=Bacillus cereus group sp. N21 TaxID=2794591 RepID=UPI0018F6C84B|nr:ATP-grasp domain-containing protein [Bacillus cereus group sp. N21]MBJ8030421.1 ATP-grasp domain-containing protein [Bacillus cereus group sp. N21]